MFYQSSATQQCEEAHVQIRLVAISNTLFSYQDNTSKHSLSSSFLEVIIPMKTFFSSMSVIYFLPSA